MTAASLFFYAWWHPSDLGLLLASIAFNYMLGRVIARAAADGRRRRAQWILAIAVAVDLLVLGYFKYANFFLGSILILGEPSDYWLPQRYFLDTVYHLNADGRAIRTARLLAQLRGRL